MAPSTPPRNQQQPPALDDSTPRAGHTFALAASSMLSADAENDPFTPTPHRTQSYRHGES